LVGIKIRVRAAETETDTFARRKGVSQGFILSPYLFNIIAEVAMMKTLVDYEGEIAIGGRRLSNKVMREKLL
jgi:hypothetical protein